MSELKKQKKVYSKADIISLVTGSTADIPKTTVASVVDATLDAIKAAIAADIKVTFIGFGTLKCSERKARIGRNPSTGKEIQIAATKSIRFTAGKAFKEQVNKDKK